MTDLLERVRQQVAGMFTRNDFDFEMLDDRSGYRVVTGSTETEIAFTEWRGDILITLNAALLVDPPQRGRTRTAMLERINALNRDIPLGKVYVTEGDPENDIPSMIQLDYQLLGQNLDLSEFFPALEHVASLAEEMDDQLKAEFGGHLLIEDDDDDPVET